MTTESRVGLFTLAGVALFAAGVLMLGDVEFKHRYRLNIVFATAEGLPDKGPVKVAGVEVGKVERVTLKGGRARVTIRLDEGLGIHQDAKAYVASTGLIGSKYLNLTLGSESLPLLKEGETIQGQPSFTFDDMMKKMREFLEDDGSQGSFGSNLKITMANLRDISSSLNQALGQQEQRLVEIVDNVHALSANARNVSADWAEITRERKEDVKVALAKIRSVSERLDDLAAKIQRGEGTLGKLVTDEEMGQDLKAAVTSVRKAAQEAQTVLGRITMVDVYWDYRQRYDFEDDQFRADVGLKIAPRHGKYYFIQGNNLGEREDRKVAGSDLEKRNTITAVMGRDFGPLTLYGGIIRSAGGAGARLRPLSKTSPWHRRFELELEAYNFPRDEVIQGVEMEGAVVNAGARFLAKDPWAWVGAQVEDVGERKNFNANVNLSFKDEDIAYLLGFVGLAR